MRNKLRSRAGVFALVAASLLMLGVQRAAAQAFIETNKSDYFPLETAFIKGTGFLPGETVTLQVTNPSHPDPGNPIYQLWNVVATWQGKVSSSYFIDEQLADASLQLSAVGNSSGLLALTTFLDSGGPDSADIDQCANGPESDPSDCEWVNGNLGASKAHWLEGDFVPYRLVFNKLNGGSHTRVNRRLYTNLVEQVPPNMIPG